MLIAAAVFLGQNLTGIGARRRRVATPRATLGQWDRWYLQQASARVSPLANFSCLTRVPRCFHPRVVGLHAFSCAHAKTNATAAAPAGVVTQFQGEIMRGVFGAGGRGRRRHSTPSWSVWPVTIP